MAPTPDPTEPDGRQVAVELLAAIGFFSLIAAPFALAGAWHLAALFYASGLLGATVEVVRWFWRGDDA